MTVVATDRLLLRPLVESDLPAYVDVAFHPEVARWLPEREGAPQDLAREQIARFALGWAERGLAPWAVIERASGRLIGRAGLNFWAMFGAVELLYALHPDVHRRGYAAEASAAALRFGFIERRLESIFAVAKVDNVASRRTMESAGLRWRRDMDVLGIRAAYCDVSAAEWAASVR
jgi:ribosomal-protein-alanine N-acetyltransferase